MQAEKLEFDQIRYNPEIEGFEAALRIHDSKGVFTYPASIRAPLTASYENVAHRLAEKGVALHKARANALRIRLRQTPQAPATGRAA